MGRSTPPRAVRFAVTSAARGFTLIEAIVALSLFSVATGFALIGAAPTLYAASARSAAIQVATDLRAARMKAIAQNTRFRVVFAADDGTYTVEREVAPGVFATDVGPAALPTSVSLGAATPDNPIFDPRGSLNAVTTVIVTGHGRTYTVSVNLLGRVRVTS
jgi:prepilin-type N-terminal cleavage/methylation domain-containing protein